MNVNQYCSSWVTGRTLTLWSLLRLPQENQMQHEPYSTMEMASGDDISQHAFLVPVELLWLPRWF